MLYSRQTLGKIQPLTITERFYPKTLHFKFEYVETFDISIF